MWDIRDPSLPYQAPDASQGHAPGTLTPADPLLNQIVSFETALVTREQSQRGPKLIGGAHAVLSVISGLSIRTAARSVPARSA